MRNPQNTVNNNNNSTLGVDSDENDDLIPDPADAEEAELFQQLWQHPEGALVDLGSPGQSIVVQIVSKNSIGGTRNPSSLRVEG